MTDSGSTHDERRRDILTQVARGDLAPEQAAELLAAIEREVAAGDAAPADASTSGTGASASGTGASTPWSASSSSSSSSSTGSSSSSSSASSDGLATGVRVIRVEGALRIVEVQGDASVREAVASGPHSARRDGDVLVIEGQPDFLGDDGDDDDDDDSDFPGARFRFRGPVWSSARAGVVVGGRRHNIHTIQGARRQPLVIRMHPDLELLAHVEAGTLSVKDVKGPIKATVQAGSAKIKGFASPLDLDVSAGSVTARGHLDHGESKVSCDAGSVKLILDRTSSVTIDASSNLGKVSLPGAPDGPGGIQGLLQSSHQATVGGGEGSLHISVNVGSASVTIDE
jgi:hypothetical protein